MEPVDTEVVLVTYETVAGETNWHNDAMKRQTSFEDTLGRLMGMAGRALRRRLDQNLAEAARFSRFHIEMKRLRIMRHGREQQIVGFSDRTPNCVFDPLAHFPFIEQLARHRLPPA